MYKILALTFLGLGSRGESSERSSVSADGFHLNRMDAMRMSMCLFRVAALLLIPLLAMSPRAVAGFIPTLHTLSDEGARRLEAARQDLEGRIVRQYLMARGQKEEAAAGTVAGMSDKQRRRTIDVDIPRYIKGNSGDALLILLGILLVGGVVLGAALGGGSSQCDDDDYHRNYCCP